MEFRDRIERDGAVETVRLVCDEALIPRGFYVAVRRPEGWRTLEAVPRREGGWLAVVVGPDGARDRRELALPPDVLVDYPSAVVEAAGRRRLGLAPGEAREVPVLRVTPALDAAAAVRRYVGE
jgi:hypothetical protein